MMPAPAMARLALAARRQQARAEMARTCPTEFFTPGILLRIHPGATAEERIAMAAALLAGTSFTVAERTPA